MRDTLLIIHILAAGSWIGANAVQFLITPRIGDQGAAVAAAWHRGVIRMGRLLYMPASIIVLITGIMLLTVVDDSRYEMSDAFVSVGFVAVIIGAGLGMGFFLPQARSTAAAYESGDTGTAAAIERKVAIVGLLDTAIIVLAVVAMVGKWGT